MSAYITRLETALPDNRYSQDYALQKMEAWLQDPVQRRKARAIYRRSGIVFRHSALPDFIPGEPAILFQEPGESLSRPGTAARNQVYAEASRKLMFALGEQLFAVMDAGSITHLIFVTCTGFSNPGPEMAFQQQFGLRPDLNRTTVGFMGCYAALSGLRLAASICGAEPEAKVLLISLELCSLHLNLNPNDDSLMANAIFADGAAAAVVQSRPLGEKNLEIQHSECLLLSKGEADMAWEIGDYGFDIRLSSYVPRILGETLKEMLDPDGVDLWAVHPGGRSILDHVSQALALPADALDIPRTVLRNYGNMSSATLLFVFAEMLRQAKGHERMLAMGFGPGLTLEKMRLRVAAHG